MSTQEADIDGHLLGFADRNALKQRLFAQPACESSVGKIHYKLVWFVQWSGLTACLYLAHLANV